MNELENLMSYITSAGGLPNIILFISGSLFFIIECIKLGDYILSRLGIETRFSLKRKQESETLSHHDEQLAKMQTELETLKIASREILGDRLNQKYKVYLRKGYIPEDEYEEFISFHDAYNGIGGNHTGDAKFEKCIKDLPIRTDEHLNIRCI